MQEGEGRYVIKAFDANTWLVYDSLCAQSYALILVELDNFTVQLLLVELITTSGNPRYLAFLKEVMSGVFTAYSAETGRAVAQYVLSELEEGHDVANPVNIAARLGADLHGQRVEWPPQRAH